MHITFGGLIFLLLIFLIPAAIILINKWRKTGSLKPNIKFKKNTTAPNVCFISARKGEYYEYIENPEDKYPDVIPQLCRDNGNEYYVIRVENKEESEFFAPDSCRYYDPEEYAKVLMMKSNEKLFEKRALMPQVIQLGILGGVFAGAAILLIII